MTELAVDSRVAIVVACARRYVHDRREYAEMRTSRRHSGMDVSAARRRRDQSAALLAVAVEELDR